MTILGKVIIGAMLVTAGVLIFKGTGKPIAVVSNDATLANNQSETSTDITKDAPVASSTVNENMEFNGSVQDLMARGGSYKCTFNQKTAVSDSTGTVFVSNKNVRGDFNTHVSIMSQSTTIDNHMISDGDFIYTWSGAMPNGLKLPVDKTASSSSANAQSFDYNQKLDYSCSPWTIDPNKFVLPSDIEFKTTLEIN